MTKSSISTDKLFQDYIYSRDKTSKIHISCVHKAQCQNINQKKNDQTLALTINFTNSLTKNHLTSWTLNYSWCLITNSEAHCRCTFPHLHIIQRTKTFPETTSVLQYNRWVSILNSFLAINPGTCEKCSSTLTVFSFILRWHKAQVSPHSFRSFPGSKTVSVFYHLCPLYIAFCQTFFNPQTNVIENYINQSYFTFLTHHI